MRRAWKVRLAGCPPVRRAGAGIVVAEQVDETRGAGERLGLALLDDGSGDLAGELLLAVGAQDPGELGGRVAVEHVGRGRALGVVHPHVERGVLGVGEAALANVELHRGDTEVEQDAVGRLDAELGRGPPGSRRTPRARGWCVPRRGPAARRRGRGRAGRGRRRPGGPAGTVEDRLAVAAEAQGRVDEDRARSLQRRGHQRNDPVEEDRDVGGTAHLVRAPSSGPGG